MSQASRMERSGHPSQVSHLALIWSQRACTGGPAASVSLQAAATAICWPLVHQAGPLLDSEWSLGRRGRASRAGSHTERHDSGPRRDAGDAGDAADAGGAGHRRQRGPSWALPVTGPCHSGGVSAARGSCRLPQWRRGGSCSTSARTASLVVRRHRRRRGFQWQIRLARRGRRGLGPCRQCARPGTPLPSGSNRARASAAPTRSRLPSMAGGCRWQTGRCRRGGGGQPS